MRTEDIHLLKYLPLERLTLRRPVDRFGYVRNRCRGLRVLDLGAYDETEIGKNQHKSWTWLHRSIAGSAKEVLGVDSSLQLAERGTIRTEFGSQIVFGTVTELEGILTSFRPDLVVAGELIEHTPNTLEWLSRIGEILPGTKLLLTTPNSTSIVNIVLSFLNRENTHQDHLHIYSHKTLATLARRLALTEVVITPYYYHSHLFRGRTPTFLLPIVYAVDYLCLTPIQFMFPMTAGGVILEGTVG
jgi:hypothetical protein